VSLDFGELTQADTMLGAPTRSAARRIQTRSEVVANG
jgi:hypothetical protein